jgi:hypothetical protein
MYDRRSISGGGWRVDLDLLNEHSRRFAEALLREFPEWAPYLRLADGREAPGTLVVEVPPPPPGTGPLWIDTGNGEITVAFADWHSHYGSLTGADDEQATRDALDAIHEIIDERLLSVAAMEGGRWRRSWSVAPGEPVETRHGDTTRVRSWRGTYDAELPRG